MSPGGVIVPDLSNTEQALLGSFGLSDAQRETVDAAFRDAPQGLIVVALECRRYGGARGTTGAGLLMHRIKLGEHYDEELKLDPFPQRAKITGWRCVRGSHAESWIQDPTGTDVPNLGRYG